MVHKSLEHIKCNNIILLLTATIDVKGAVFTKRNDPTIRYNDYREALSHWLAIPYPNRINHWQMQLLIWGIIWPAKMLTVSQNQFMK